MSKPDTEQGLKIQIQIDVLEIRHLARQIKTKAQFEGIVKGILDPYMQGEIKKLLIPLLPFAYEDTDAAGGSL